MVLNSDTHPFIVVMGGKKVDDKIVLIEKLWRNVISFW